MTQMVVVMMMDVSKFDTNFHFVYNLHQFNNIFLYINTEQMKFQIWYLSFSFIW